MPGRGLSYKNIFLTACLSTWEKVTHPQFVTKYFFILFAYKLEICVRYQIYLTLLQELDNNISMIVH